MEYTNEKWHNDILYVLKFSSHSINLTSYVPLHFIECYGLNGKTLLYSALLIHSKYCIGYRLFIFYRVLITLCVYDWGYVCNTCLPIPPALNFKCAFNPTMFAVLSVHNDRWLTISVLGMTWWYQPVYWNIHGRYGIKKHIWLRSFGLKEILLLQKWIDFYRSRSRYVQATFWIDWSRLMHVDYTHALFCGSCV